MRLMSYLLIRLIDSNRNFLSALKSNFIDCFPQISARSTFLQLGYAIDNIFSINYIFLIAGRTESSI